MDGENNGKPYEQMDDLGVPLFSETSIYWNPFEWLEDEMSLWNGPFQAIQVIIEVYRSIVPQVFTDNRLAAPYIYNIAHTHS